MSAITEAGGSPGRPASELATLGLRPNLLPLGLLMLVTAFVGGMVGLERSILPVIAREDFGIASHAAAIAFIATFGFSKAVINLFAGGLADRWGRRNCLITGWLVGLPVPLIVMVAPDWSWVLFANVLLGVNQALTWSMAVNMKIDLARPQERGLAVGLNEFAGYCGLAAVALITGIIAGRYGLRPAPFYLGLGLAAAGLIASLFVRDTRPAAASRSPESRVQSPESPGPDFGLWTRNPGPARSAEGAPLNFGRVFRWVSWGDAALSSASLAGLATNLKDGMLWGLLPLYLGGRGLDIAQVAVVAALYPAVWGVAQLPVGILSDRVSRAWLVSLGLGIQGLGVAAFVFMGTYGGCLLAAVLAGLGTALAYPTLQAFVSDLAEPSWRASALGVYRFWRDSGYVIGALGAGYVADLVGINWALLASGLVLAITALVFASVAGIRGRGSGIGPRAEPIPDPQRNRATGKGD